jgi:hypothetical protein
MASTWGEPEISNTSPMQGPAQISAVADYAMAVGIRHFPTQAALNAASGAVADYYAIVTAIPGALFRYTGSAWRMTGTAQFADAAAASAITAPHQGMRRRLATKLYDEEYFALWETSSNPFGRAVAGWYPVGQGLVPIMPTSLAGSNGTSVIYLPTGGVEFSAASTVMLNGIFSPDFDNYRIVVNIFAMTTNGQVGYRLATIPGSDTSASYTYQNLHVGGNTIQAAQAGPLTAWGGSAAILAQEQTAQLELFGPYRPMRTTGVITTTSLLGGQAAPGISRSDVAHMLNTQFTGMEFICVNGTTMTGRIHVYGYNN